MKTIDFSKLKVGAILNTNSGSCDASSEEKMRNILAEGNVTPPEIWCGEANDMKNFFAAAAAARLDVLIVLGGDGTIRSGAEACTPKGPLLIPLPGGTMNILPKALYGDLSWEEVLTAILQKATSKSVSGGSIAGRQFFIMALLGAPALWANVREAIREGEVVDAFEKGIVAFQSMLTSTIHYSFSRHMSGDVRAIIVTCPLISNALIDTARSFEAAVFDIENARELLKLASGSVFGEWKDSEHVTLVKTKSVSVTSRKKIPVIIDGEPIDCGKEVQIKFVPEAFKAIVPVLT